ncbi:MAG TPA: hypothetical protein P5291_05755 [Flavobacteriales bacterium]|nr:hypothetical protein [Flavobacteriales bacterium]
MNTAQSTRGSLYLEMRNMGMSREPTPSTSSRNQPTTPKWACKLR